MGVVAGSCHTSLTVMTIDDFIGCAWECGNTSHHSFMQYASGLHD